MAANLISKVLARAFSTGDFRIPTLNLLRLDPRLKLREAETLVSRKLLTELAGNQAYLTASALPQASPCVPAELRELEVAAKLGIVPERYFSGIGDAASILEVPPAPSLEELAQKRTLISAWLAEKSADRVIVEKLNNQAWLTGGLDFHEISNTSVVKIEVPKNPEEPIAIYLNNIERPRIVHHELAKLGEDWITAIKLVINNWAVEPALPRGRKVVTDTGTDFDRLHYSFLPADLDRYRWLGQMAAAALTKAAWLTVPDRDSEKDVETRIFSMLNPHEIFPEVLLVASDYYHFLTNHPIARLGAIIKRDLIMVLCARWHGYIVNLSRQVHFGRITSDSELAIIFAQCSRIFAQAVNQTRPGILFRNIFQNMQARATRLGYPTATEDVHFGGPTGIGIRDFCATAESPEEVLAFQPFTWNPILRGASSKVKCEDTYCTGAKANSRPERITIDPYGYWPLRNVGGGGRSKMSYAVPRIFEYLQK